MLGGLSFTGKGRRLAPLIVVAILGAAALAGYLMWWGYRAALAEAEKTTRNFAWLLEANLDSTLRRVDATLREIGASVSPMDVTAAAVPARAARVNALLDAEMRSFPELAGFRVFDANGDMLYTSAAATTPHIGVGDRGYFTRLRDDPRAELVFSESLTARTTGHPSVIVGRALRDGGGRFVGAITGVLELEHFQRQFGALDIGQRGVLAIRRSDDFALVLRRPPVAADENRTLPPRNPLVEALAAGQRMATVRLSAPSDGIDRIVSIRVLEGYPYFVIAGLAVDEVLAGWRARTLSVGVLGALLLGFLGFVLARLVAAERDSERIVGELAESSRHLLEHDARLNEALDIARMAEWSYDLDADRFVLGDRVAGLLRCDATPPRPSAAEFKDLLVHPDDAPQLDALLERARAAPAGARSWEEPLRLRCGDGVARWMLLRYQRADGGVAGQRIAGTLIDIHERREAVAALRALSAMQSAILEAADYSVISTTPEGVITSFNHAAERMLGYGAEEVIGRVTPEVIHDAAEVVARAAEFSAELGEDIAPGFEVFVARSRRHLPNAYEWTYVRKDGSRFPVLLSITALRDSDGAITGFLGIAADITEWRRATQALRESEAALNAAQAVAHIGSWTLDIPGNSLIWSDETYRIFGVERGTPLTYDLFLDGVHPDDRAAVAAAWNAAMAGAPYDIEHRLRGDGDGEVRWVRERAEIAFDAAGKPLSGVGTVQDITERKAAEQRLRLLAVAFQHSGEALLITDRDNHILEVNPAFTRFTGYTLDEVRGRNPRVLSAGRTTPDTYRAMWQGILGSGYWQGEVWDRRKDGGIYPKLLTITAVRDADGTITHHVGSFSDITAQKATEERIRHLALHDALTGLPNRLDLQGRLQQSLAAARRDQQQVAVMLLDLDRFKPINDSLGHMAGDALLIEVARRLKSAVRDSDIVARLGGDEFVVVLPGIPGRAAAGHMADKLVAAIDEPYRLEGHDVTISPSIGVALFPADGDDDETLLRRADEAMYRAKSHGRDNWQFYAG